MIYCSYDFCNFGLSKGNVQVLEVHGCSINSKAQIWEVGMNSQLLTEHLTIESEEARVARDDSSGLGNYGKSTREARFSEAFLIFTFLEREMEIK